MTKISKPIGVGPHTSGGRAVLKIPRSLKANARSGVGGARRPVEVPNVAELSADGGVEAALKAARQTIRIARSLHTRYREKLREGVAQCCAIAEFLRSDKASWKTFVKREFWLEVDDPPKENEADEALRYVLLHAAGETGEAARKQVSKLYIAVRPLLDAGVRAAEIPSKVKEAGGFAKLASAHAKNPRGGTRDAGRTLGGDDARQPARTRQKGERHQKAPGTLILRAAVDASARRDLRSLSAPCRVGVDIRLTSLDGYEAEGTIFSATLIDDV